MRIADNDMRETTAFRIGEQDLCVGVLSLREIRAWTPAMPSTHSPKDMDRGIIPIEGRTNCLRQLNALFDTLESEAA